MRLPCNYLRLNPVEKEQFQVEVDKIKLPKEREEVMEITTRWMEEGIVKGERALTIRLLRATMSANLIKSRRPIYPLVQLIVLP